MTIRLHHGQLARSLRILWLLEEMELPYQVVPYASIADHQTPEFLALSPLGLLPVIEDGDQVVFESGAIIEYLLETYGERGLRPPKGTADWVRYQTWLHAAETLVWPLGLYATYALEPPGLEPEGGVRAKEMGEAWRPRLERYLDALESVLSTRDYVAGDAFRAADILLSYFVLGARVFGGLGERPHLAAYADRILARPAAAKLQATVPVPDTAAPEG